MSWFNVIKTLQSKTGYAQLDFDNIVEEEETNCLKRLKEWSAKVHKYTVDGQRKKLGVKFNDETRHLFLDKEDITYNMNVYNEFPDIPEETACALIEFIQGIKDYKYAKKEGSEQGQYYFSFSEHDYQEPFSHSYMFLYIGVGRKMYKIFFTNTLEEKEKFKRWLSSVV
jgi:hypothetical protein